MIRNTCILFLLWTVSYCVCNIVRRSQDCRGNICKFRWVVDYKFTMMWYNNTSPDLGYQPIIQDPTGFIRRRSTSPNCTETHTTVTLSEFKELVSTGDGDYRMVYAINGQIPGPEIIVTEGDMVSIRIYNRLKIEGLTIHWHGLLHRGTPWMDGASMISQCPILPGQVFEYRFLAEPVGTHWYHAHTNTMRSDGLSGAFIVLPKKPPHPDYYGEFFAVIQDWTKRSAAETAETYRSRLFGLDEYNGQCTPSELMPDGTASIFSLNVGLVNGRGRRYRNGDFVNGEKPFIPLEIFTVEPMKWYRFRIINVGFAQPFQISFEAHTIYVVALDGNDVIRQKCDSVVISPGESVDIQIKTRRSPNNYYINFKTLPTQTQSGPIERPQMTRAILNYKGVSQYQQALSVPRLCTQRSPCYVVNQLYGRSPANSNIVNIPFMKIRSTAEAISRNPVPTSYTGSTQQEFFLNFHFFRGHPAINGRRFMYPTSALQTHRTKRGTTPCNPPYCTSERCRCTHTLKLEIDNVIQFVFFTQGLKAAHPIHFHGHQFHVVKVGYPVYDEFTGNATAPNPDIKCLNDDCTEATWSNPSWKSIVPGLNLRNPPIKDTVNVPWGGYVVVRIIADNPGYWLLHCHLGHHQSQGMSLVLQEGDPADMVEAPSGFPLCHSFLTSQDKIENAIRNQKKILERKRNSKNSKPATQTKKTNLRDFFKEEQTPTGRSNNVQNSKRNLKDFYKEDKSSAANIVSNKNTPGPFETTFSFENPRNPFSDGTVYTDSQAFGPQPLPDSFTSSIGFIQGSDNPLSIGPIEGFQNPFFSDSVQTFGDSLSKQPSIGSTGGENDPFRIPTQPTFGESFTNQPSIGSIEGDFNPLFRIPTEPTFGESFTNQPSIGSIDGAHNPFQSPSQLTLPDSFSNLPSIGSTHGVQNPFESLSQLTLPDTFSNIPPVEQNPFQSPSQLTLPDSLSNLPSIDGAQNPFRSTTETTFGDLFSPGTNNLPSIGSTGGGPDPMNGFSSMPLDNSLDSSSRSSLFLTSDALSASGPLQDYFASANDATTLNNMPHNSISSSSFPNDPVMDSSSSLGETSSANPFRSFNQFFENDPSG
uniref:Uncharacterized protein LOC111114035 n=1 Tax=Crassostrea virginica TaxID=6565 RepID=A0A8B8BXC4_CRAVI|nr:uncharacterized protein LOC111114035 [Crassostrea virginica]